MRTITVVCVVFVVMAAGTPVRGQLQTAIVRDTFARPAPLVGLNAPGLLNVATWTMPPFVDTLARLNPPLLRYPGGLPANLWDWKTGWFQANAPFPACSPGVKPPITVRPEEFKIGLDACRAQMLFTINVFNSSAAYQLEGIRHVRDLGIPLTFVEFGNEHNLACEPIDPHTYGLRAKAWGDSIKREFPSMKICLVGGDIPGSHPGWIDSVTRSAPPFDAFAFHLYAQPGTADGHFDVTRALAVPFTLVDSRFTASHFTRTATPKEVWVTEFNMNEVEATGKRVLNGTWTHALFVLAMAHAFLQHREITMLVNWSAVSPDEYVCIDPFTHHISANGVAMKILADATRGSDSCRRLAFTTNPTLTSGTARTPTLIGWEFWNTDTAIPGRALLVNLSRTAIAVDAGVLEGRRQATVYAADTAYRVDGIERTLRGTVDADSGFILPAFGVAVIAYDRTGKRDTTIDTGHTAVRAQIAVAPRAAVYPNPAHGTLSIDVSGGATTVVVTDIMGRIVARCTTSTRIATEGWARGVYAVRTSSGTRSTYSMVVVE